MLCQVVGIGVEQVVVGGDWLCYQVGVVQLVYVQGYVEVWFLEVDEMIVGLYVYL